MIFLEIRRRKFIRVVSYLVAVSVVLAASGTFAMTAKAGYEETLGKVRLSNLTSLCEYTREVGSGLRVLAVSSGDSMTDSMAFVRDRIMGAVGCIHTFDTKRTKHMTKFFGKAYNFAENFTGTEKERESAVRLSMYAQEVYYHLNDVSSAVLNGAYSVTEYGSVYKKSDKPYFEEFLDYTNGKETELFRQISPASAQAREYGFLAGLSKIPIQSAKDFASLVSGVNSALWRECDDTDSPIPLHSFRHGDVRVDICENGGMLCRLINPVKCETAFYTESEAETFASDFLSECGFNDMVCTDKSLSEFSSVFVFVPSVNGILLMNAPVEIAVCLSNGAITFFDSSEYLRKYRTDIDAMQNEINIVLPENFEVRESVRCIADINGKEKQCILAFSDFEGEEVRSYIDAQSGRVLKTEIK